VLVHSHMFQTQWLLHLQPMQDGRALQCQLLRLALQMGLLRRSQVQTW